MNRRFFLGLTVSALALLPVAAAAQDKMPVVASFSILGDMVSAVGGDRVAVTTIVGADGDAHVYSPTPADAQAVAGAKVVFVNGIAFEGWLDRLIEASEYKGPVVIATTGIEPLEMAEEGHDEHAAGEKHADHTEGEKHHDHAGHDHDDHAGHDHGAFDPHAWQSLVNARVYVANIEAGLAAADPAGATVYAANAAAYVAQIDTLDAKIKAAVAALPEANRSVVTSHDAFGYFGAAYGLTFHAPEGLSTESEASAADVAALITQMKDEAIPAVFMENITDSRLLEQITSETSAKIGGTLYSDALSGPDGPASTYLNMMRHNITTLTAALGA
ncbi:zinc/manganese transport system substrate-binding protein [Pseudorhodobacter antarcticus]|uniref:Zinc/manganese transport system substrate-binding protein n=1 Tax=Pseudorhodobacter antarcticus TaxID=1077947 RepID=A0A1H8LFG2_9RHOB|nr:zinc ABC transporter substrate-binding protein [Pseudorhodobacter antarcticus]SEO03837.1 zinc/manganese transport system substrate-binding protein [Pseudorhodobacter antarcticus]